MSSPSPKATKAELRFMLFLEQQKIEILQKELERLREKYLVCCVCQCELMESEDPHHCKDCIPFEDQDEEDC